MCLVPVVWALGKSSPLFVHSRMQLLDFGDRKQTVDMLGTNMNSTRFLSRFGDILFAFEM